MPSLSVEISDEVLALAHRCGVRKEGTRAVLTEMAEFAAPFSDSLFNWRFEAFLFAIVDGELVDIFRPRKFHTERFVKHVTERDERCEDCSGDMFHFMQEECEACAGKGCPRCFGYGEHRVRIPCQNHIHQGGSTDGKYSEVWR